MATVAHYIRSEYDPEHDKQRLLRETGQPTDDAEAAANAAADDVDPWQTESSAAGFHKSRRLAYAPKFVPATLSYDEWGSTSASAQPPASDPADASVARWYRSLGRQRATAPSAAPDPSPPPQHSTAPDPPTSSAPAPTPSRRARGRDWFISRAVAHAASAPPAPSSSSSLADMLARRPPARAQPLRPPVFLHLAPSNKGWALLQSQGWSEGEGLGRTRGDAARAGPSSSLPLPRAEVLLDDDNDDIVEVQKAPVIDLTLSESESESESEDGAAGDDASEASPRSPLPTHADTTTAAHATDPRAAQTALLTPLPTVLKADRLGIGLKARTAGPHCASVKRVTHNAAALAAHERAAEARRRMQAQVGRGRRAFARVARAEAARREEMMAYLGGS
ncbi:hypothetical protein BC834DRAFT_973632 [Gloeopeniophorella convolvens]|nr:hypothetical protein BC834DRAFT_973632 [Gloeopeniophorella convolvens]